MKKLGLKILPHGLAYKQYFTAWELIPNYFQLHRDPYQEIRQKLVQHSCATTHSEFLQKCGKPLWKNEDFFISLPFKQNEDINPTKASHPGLSPEHQKMAIDECAELQQQGLIEPTNLPWACHVFYVNKRSKQIRGKQRLIINYQPLNHFLADDKFPLPNKQTLLSSLSNAKVFSKFDLKVGFWQLGIKPTDRPKTAFSIPNHHFQWTVMSFGLKNSNWALWTSLSYSNQVAYYLSALSVNGPFWMLVGQFKALWSHGGAGVLSGIAWSGWYRSLVSLLRNNKSN